MPRPPLRLSRRTALAGAAGAPLAAGLALGLGACGADTDSPADRAADSAADTAADADTALVAEVLADLALAHHVVQANRRAHPGLKQQLLPVERLHVVHARELSDEPLEGVTGRAADPQESAAQALVRVGRAEARLERRLEAAAIAAQSGALALVLASMTVGTAQLRAAT